MNNLSALDSPESCITHPVSGFSRFVAVLALLFLTISTAFAQPPLPSGDCGRNVLEFEAGYLSTIVNGLPISSQGSGTWEAWVKKDNWAAGQPEFTLFSNAYAYPNAKAFYVSLHPAVGLHFRSGYEGGGYAAYPTTMQYVTNSWHHFAATWSEDGSNVTIAIYVDGDSITSTVTTAKFGLESGFYFGGSPAHPTFAPGSMADIRLWDVAKTEAEISASMSSMLIGNEAGLIGYWPLNDVTGSSTATNLVAGGSAATLVSMSPSSAWVTSHPFKITSGAEVKSGSTTDFGTQMTGLSSEARVFTIINDGTSALNFQGSPISQLMGTDADQFILDLTGTSGSLAAGATTTFSVSFSPTTEGVKTASISFTNVESCEDPYIINLSGIGSTLSGSISIDSHVSIYSGSDGQLTVSSTGGTEPYTYLWSNGATGSTVEGLSAGAYSVTIADNAGASVVRSATITQPDELIVTLEVNAHVSTVGGNDGAVTASVVGGVEPYSYLWNNDETIAAITDLVSGEYTVTVTDMNGAVASERITVTQPKAVSAYIQVVTEPGSNGNYGELSAYAHHGAPPYSYLWSTGATTQVISGLSTGTYSVTITDGYSMESVASVTFKSATIEYSGSFSEASANDGSVQGSLNVSLSGDMFSESDDILDENEVTVSGIPAGMNYDFEITERHAVGEVWDTLMGFSNSDGYWSDLTYGNERYVAVSSSYFEYGVMISYDGMRWQGVDNTYDSWKAITFGDSLFVAVSEYGYITRSSDGINWSETYLDDITFSDVVFGNGLFVAVASSYDYESIMVSPDGATWEAPTDYSHNSWAAVSYGAGMFIAISGDGQPMTSQDGWEWSVEEATTIENVSNIAYGNGLFVVTTSSGEIWTSSDGSSWSQRMDVSDVLSAITYGQGEFMVVTDNDVDNLIYKSSNGIDWSTVALGSVGFNAIAYGKGRFIAMGDYHSSPGWIITSKLGSTATLSFAGNATAHQDADDISDIQIEFSDAAFANVEAADVINAVGSSGVGVDFNDNPNMVYSGVGFRATGAGNVEGRIVITLNGENFQDDDEDGLLDINDEIIIGNIPGVLTPMLTITAQTQQGLDWTDGTDTSISGTYTAAAYGNGTYVALNYNSTDYIYSTDGANWVEAELNYDGWWDVTYANGLFVAVGSAGNGYVMTSTDGVNWDYQEVYGYWEGVTYAEGRFVVVGDNAAMYSSDAQNWIVNSEVPSAEWFAVTYGNGKFVAVSPNSPNAMVSEDGASWLSVSSEIFDDGGLEDITYGNGLFVGLGGYGDDVYTSVDGFIWTAHEIDYGNWNWLTYGGGQFIIVGENYYDDAILRSVDGQSWSGTNNVIDIDLNVVLYAEGSFLAFTDQSDQWLLKSEPTASTAQLTLSGSGLNTSDNTEDITFEFADYAFANIAAAYVINATGPASSGLGLTFHPKTASMTYAGEGFTEAVANDGSVEGSIQITLTGDHFANGNEDNFLEVGTEVVVNNIPEGLTPALAITESSALGVTWTSTFPEGTAQYKSVAYGNGIYVAMADYGANKLITSNDGINWTPSEAQDAENWASVAFGNGIFVALPYYASHLAYTSEDGVNWTARAPSSEQGWIDITFGNGRFVAIRPNGTDRVMTSLDGIHWTLTAGDENVGDFVGFGNGLFVSGSYGEDIATSPDGINWTPQELSSSEGSYFGINDVAYGNGLFVLVGDYSEESSIENDYRVLTSPDAVTWTPRSVDMSDWFAVDYGGGLFVAVAYNGTNRVMTSEDGINWTVQPDAPLSAWDDVIFGSDGFVAVANGGDQRVMTSFQTAEASLTLTGNAGAHQATHNVSDLTFEFTDAAFTNSLAVNVLNATGPASSGLGVDFENNPPANDDCANAQALSVYEPGEGTATAGSTEFAAPNAESSPCTEESNIKDVWYSFNSGESGQVIFTVEAGETTAIAGAVYTACGEIYQIESPFGDFPACALDQSELLLLTLSPNTDYLLQVWSPGGAVGDFTVLLEANAPPVIDPIADKTLDEETEIQFTVTATDDFLPLGNIEFALHGDLVNLGMSIDSESGEFSWIPSEDQGGVYEVVVYALDYLSEYTYSFSYSSDTFNITVNEVNVAPVLDAVEDQTATVGETLSFTISGSDNDLPSNVLTYSLDAISLEKGMSLNSATGEFNWLPTTTDAGTSNTVTVTLSDGSLTDERSFSINTEKLSQTVTFGELEDKVYGQSAFDLTATASSELTVIFTSSDETVASVSGNTVTIMGAGTATITASQAGNDNYSAALDVSQSLTIEKATQTISFEALANRTYGDQAFDLTATASSELTVTFTSSDE
ncbi:LamG-like jellyroll fold domain-containing protein, partial [Marinoscillum sp.]|uniref:LamG-like jellyroll fold domain-containing protein n=2 Tax=Marinoscillum sp. TaxID=2024838 RepID=UPI0033003185